MKSVYTQDLAEDLEKLQQAYALLRELDDRSEIGIPLQLKIGRAKTEICETMERVKLCIDEAR